MWTTENRPRYNRDKLRYPSDLTDQVPSCMPAAKHPGTPDAGNPHVRCDEGGERAFRPPSGAAASGVSTCARWSMA